jgi:hypothetical protein
MYYRWVWETIDKNYEFAPSLISFDPPRVITKGKRILKAEEVLYPLRARTAVRIYYIRTKKTVKLSGQIKIL